MKTTLIFLSLALVNLTCFAHEGAMPDKEGSKANTSNEATTELPVKKNPQAGWQ